MVWLAKKVTTKTRTCWVYMYVYMQNLCILCSFLAQIWSVQGVSFNKTLAETSSSWGACSCPAADGVEVCAWPFGADVSYRHLPWCHQLERWHHILLFRQGHWVTWGVLKSHSAVLIVLMGYRLSWVRRWAKACTENPEPASTSHGLED